MHYSSTTMHYATLHYTTLNFTTLQYTYNYSHNHSYASLRYTTQDYTTLHWPKLHYTRPTTPLQYNCKCTTLITAHNNYNSTTLQLQLQLHYTTLHPAVVGEVANQVTSPRNTIPTTFQSISGFALPSVIHNNQPLLYRVSYSETSAAALCGTRIGAVLLVYAGLAPRKDG